LTLANESSEVGPEVAVVAATGTLASQGVGLTGKASANNVNWFKAGGAV
jgi:hypothetical protein